MVDSSCIVVGACPVCFVYILALLFLPMDSSQRGVVLCFCDGGGSVLLGPESSLLVSGTIF